MTSAEVEPSAFYVDKHTKISEERHLRIGALIFPDMDQCDFTGPFEVLSRIPNSTFYTLWKDKGIFASKPSMPCMCFRFVPVLSFAAPLVCFMVEEQRLIGLRWKPYRYMG